MDKNNNNTGNDLHYLFFAIFLVGGGWWLKNGAAVEYWLYSHFWQLAFLGFCLLWGMGYLLIKRWEKNNPRKVQRKKLLHMAEYLREAENAIPVAYTLKDRKAIYLSPELRTGHVQILGATGRGKTASVIVPWFLRDMRNNSVPVLIDGKGDTALVNDISPKAALLQKDIWIFNPASPEISCRINPLEGGAPNEIAERLFAALEFESSYYREVQYTAVLTILEAFKCLGQVPTLKALYEALINPQSILEALGQSNVVPVHQNRELARICQMKPEERQEKFSGIISQLRPFAGGNFERIVNSTGNHFEHLNLDEVMNPAKAAKNGIHGVIILLPTMQYQKSAKVLGKLILQYFAWSTAKREREQAVTPIFIDEFSAFVYEGFEQFLNKARSKGVALHLSHQSMGDLEAVSPSFAKTVNVNTNIKVLLGLNDPDTADYFARHLGTFTTTKSTERATRAAWGQANKTGDMSMRDVEEYKIHPNRLKAFSNGQGVLSLLIHGEQFAEEVQFVREV